MRLLIGLVAVAACAAPPRRAVDYRNKAREQFNSGSFGMALADYEKAKEIDKKGRIAGINGERQRAALEYVREKLRAAWQDYNARDYIAAHGKLVALKKANAFGVKDVDPLIERSIADTVAMAFEADVNGHVNKGQTVKAVLLAEHLVSALPPSHPLQVRFAYLKARAVAYHLAQMRAQKDQFPMAAAFHYMVALRLGGDPDPDGPLLLAATKGQSGDPADMVKKAQAASQDASRLPEVEHLLIKARAISNSWSDAAVKYFDGRYGTGIDDTKLLDDIWQVQRAHALYAAADPESLPTPDEIAVRLTDDASATSEEYGARPRTMDFSYGVGRHVAGEDLLGTNLGASMQFPSKKTKSIYELSGHLESSSLGGNSSGYGVDVMISRLIKAPVVAAIGVGYMENESVVDTVMNPTGLPLLQRSLHIPIVARVPLFQGYGASVEYRANIYQYTKDEDTTSPNPEQYFSPLTARLYGPIPLLSEPIPFLRNFTIELNASHVSGAPVENVYGGRLLYRRSTARGGGGSSSDIKDSVFAIQTLIGPTIDLYYEYGAQTPLMKSENSLGIDSTGEAGMGAILRIPGKRDDKGTDLALWFHSASLGGNIGGWGGEWLTLKGGGEKTPFVFGYGIGFASDSISNLPTSPTMPLPGEMKHTSLHSPLVLRFALGATLIGAIEGRINWLQLGGSGNASSDCVMMSTCESRHFSPIGARLWMPIPILGDALEFIRKFHLEGHVTYYLGAKDDDLYGNQPLVFGFRVVWRPIQSKR